MENIQVRMGGFLVQTVFNLRINTVTYYRE